MPNKHAAIKDLRKNKRRAAKNSRMKTHTKSLLRQVRLLISQGKKTEALALAPKLQQTLDKAGKTGVVHKNKSARLMSVVHRSLVK